MQRRLKASRWLTLLLPHIYKARDTVKTTLGGVNPITSAVLTSGSPHPLMQLGEKPLLSFALLY